MAFPLKLEAVLNDSDVLPFINNWGENEGSTVKSEVLSMLYILAIKSRLSRSGRFDTVIMFASVNRESVNTSSSTVSVQVLLVLLK